MMATTRMLIFKQGESGPKDIFTGWLPTSFGVEKWRFC